MKCWLVQKIISLYLNDTRGWHRWAQQHSERCPACRRYVQTQIRLAKALGSQAVEVHEPAPAFLKMRVMASIASVEKIPVTDNSRLWLGRFYYLASATAVLCLLAIGFLLWHHQPVTPVSAAALNAQWYERSANQLALLSTFRLPLEKEVDCVISDAKSALLAVADSVLPSSLLDNPSGMK